MDKKHITACLDTYDKAARVLADQVSRIFWEGRQVRVTRGNGSWSGYVTSTAYANDPMVSVVRHNKSGKRHRIHYNDLEPEGDTS